MDETTTDEVELAKLPTMMPFCNFEFGIHEGNANEIGWFDRCFILCDLRIWSKERCRYLGDR